jgi:hypothetical protein
MVQLAVEESSANEIRETARKLPVVGRYDVIVVGAGVAGISAAIASARNGMKTLLVERDGCAGGTATTGLMVVFMGVNFDVLKGNCLQLLSRLEKNKAAMIGPNTPFDPEELKFTAEEWLAENKVEILYHAWFSDVICRDNIVKGIIVELKEGRRAILGEVVVDASGDGDVAAAAGAPFEKRDRTQPLTSIFRVDKVDTKEVIKYIQENPDQFFNLPGQQTWKIDNDPPFFTIGGLFDLIRKAKRNGELYLPHDSIWFGPLPRSGEYYINTTRIGGLDGTRSEDLTKAELDVRKQARSVVEFLRKYVPGFGETRLVDVAGRIGVRETRRITGEYTLRRDDLVNGKRFEDAIAVYDFPMDVHGPAGKEESHGWTLVKVPYDIPYRVLVPKGIENLLTSGRCISVDYDAHGSTRAMPCCMATGEAAGVAAALAIKAKCSVRKVNLATLRKTLIEQGVFLR